MSLSCYEMDFSDKKLTIDDIFDDLGIAYSIIGCQLIKKEPETYRYWVLLDEKDYAKLIDHEGDRIAHANLCG